MRVGRQANLVVAFINTYLIGVWAQWLGYRGRGCDTRARTRGPHSASATGSGENRLTKQANVQHLASTWHANLGQGLYAGTESIPNEF